MTETTNPLPGDPSGPTAMPEESTLADGSQQLLDGASTGTEEGPGGIPAALVGRDKSGEQVPPPPAALPGDAPRSTGPAQDDDPLSPSDTSSPLDSSSSRGETAASGDPAAGRDGR